MIPAPTAPLHTLSERSRTIPAAGGVLKKLAPAAPGAKRYAERFGDALVCVRYREDPKNGQRLTTVELIVAARPLPTHPGLRIAYGETELRKLVKAAGARWDPEQKLWRLPIGKIRKLRLEHRIVSENA